MTTPTIKQKPSIGRIVHFNRKSGDTVVQEPALIVAVHNDECVNLVAWNSGGTQNTETSVLLGEGEGRWNWPARV